MQREKLSKKILGLSGLALLTSLGVTGCKTVRYQGEDVMCFGTYPRGHPCYTEPSSSSSSSGSSSGSSYREPNVRDRDSSSSGRSGHYEGCRR